MSPTELRPSGRKLFLFRLVALAGALLAGVVGAETLLRWRTQQVRASDALEPGLIGYDHVLGWKLMPGWKGRHTHQDFAAEYSIAHYGNRKDPAFPQLPGSRRVTMVVGDSFSFGLGVNDPDTFVARLNATAAPAASFVNASVPGYSTDQQLLLLEHRLPALRPARVLLVVYVGNDLFDNLRDVPLQVRSPKPFFELTPSGLHRRNVPVPVAPRGSRPSANSLLEAVLGPERSAWPLRTRLASQYETLALLANTLWPEPDYTSGFAARFSPAVALFDALLDRTAEVCAQAGAEFSVAVLAGRSHLLEPRSLSAQYQEYLLTQVVSSAARKGIGAIDVAAALRIRSTQTDAGANRWYFPHDGHLTPAGHRAVAEIMADALRRPRP